MPTETICEAIQDELKLVFQYDGYRRRIQPYVHGWNSSDEEIFKGYQTAGDSDSFSAPQWRTFKIEEISSLQLTDEQFTRNRDDYTPDDSDFTEVHCRIDK